MTNEELLTKIRAEIESRIKELHEAEIDYREDQCDTIVSCLVSGISELQRVLTLLNTLEKSLPSKVADGEDLDDLITRELANVYGTYTTPDYMEKDTTEESCYFESYIARHFYDLGCRRTAEKYDEIEYNRQRVEESVPKDLEEAAEKYSKERAQGHILYDWLHAFMSGAKWDREQMMKKTVEGEVFFNPYPTISLDDCKDYDFKDGDKVHIIIVKED